MPKKVLIVANPAAGRLKSKGRLEKFVSRLDAAGCETRIVWTRSAGFGGEHIDLDFERDIIVAAGGDGTLHQVVNAQYRRGEACPVAFLPFGTANVFRHEARLPRKTGDLADLVVRGAREDYIPGRGRFIGFDGKNEERIFMLMAGVGWDAAVTMSVNRKLKDRHGRAAYVMAGLGLVLRGNADKVRMRAGGREAEGELVVVANSPYYAGPFSLVPDARAGFPRLSVAVFRKISLSGLPGIFSRARRWEKDPSGNVYYDEADEIEIISPGIPIQMDGDPVGYTPASFGKAARRIPVITGDW